MQEVEKQSLEQMQAFLDASQVVRFEGEGREEMYRWVERTLREHGYPRQNRADKGLLRQYVAKMTGLSRAQVARLIRQYQEQREVKPSVYRRHRFPRQYTAGDVTLLVAVDEAHGRLSGPATRKILKREYEVFGRQPYQRLAGISVGHLYNLRGSPGYRRQRVEYQPTRPTAVSIGQRRKPEPEGKPGYLRVDTVHQGDQDGVKGVYHINAVDEVTQWEVVGATGQLSEAWLMPVLEAMLEQFPFQLRGFHSDNGSEFINHTVAGLLNKLLIEQTKSRPRRSNDNGLAEAKNGAVVRKHMGYNHIESEQGAQIQAFYQEHLNPYLNFHRPCGQPELVADAKGKLKRVYRRYATPWEVFQQLPEAANYLRPGQSMAALALLASRHSDTEAASRMQQAKRKLFTGFHPKAQHA